MPEMLKPTSLIAGAQLQNNLAIITDGRFSGGSHGFIIGHITPEAYKNGPISMIKMGDMIEIDAKKGRIDICLDSIEMTQRKTLQKEKHIDVNELTVDSYHQVLSENSNILTKYQKNVLDASHGCITI
jgi:dihydroxy-acid dehydratase